MPKLFVLVGLPASGKSTLAAEIVAKDPDHTVRVNNDDIRKMFWGHPHNSPNEQMVKYMLKAAMVGASEAGLNIVVDNLNLGKNVDNYRDWAILHEYDFTVAVIDTPIEECIRRDALREFPVGERVIRQFAKGFAHAKASQVQK